jgi:signal transduction histidine kinase
MERPELSQARADLGEAGLRLEGLKKRLAPAPAPTRPERWSALSRALSAAREVLAGWTPRPASDGSAEPALLRESSELEARALKAESALREVEARQRELDERRDSVHAELERVHEGWRLLRARAAPGAEADAAGGVPALFERWYGLLAQAASALDEERAVQEQAREAEKLWRWLVDSAFPDLERRLRAADDTLTLPTLRRLLEEQDLRFLALRRSRAQSAAAAAEEELAALRRGADNLRADLARLSASREEALNAVEPLKAEAAGLREKLAAAEQAAESAAARLEAFKALSEAARVDSDRLMEQLAETEQARAEAEAAAAARAQDVERLAARGQKALHAAETAAEEGRRLSAELQAARREAEDALAREKKALQDREKALLRAESAGVALGFEQDRRIVAERAVAPLTDALEKARRETAAVQAARAHDAQTLEKARRALLEERRALEDRARALEREAAALQGAKAALAAELRARDEGRQALKTEEAALAQRRLALEQEASALDERRRAVEAEKSAVEERKRAVDSERDALEDRRKLAETVAQSEKAALEQGRRDLERTARGLELIASRPAPAPAEPAPDAGWPAAVEALREALAPAAAQLRRLRAAAMPPDFKEAVSRAARAAAKAADILDRLAAYHAAAPAAGGSCRPEAVLEEVLAEWEPALRARGVTLSRAVTPGLPAAAMPASALRMALYELLRNAAQAMPSGGALEAGAFHAEAARRVVVTVRDTGPGLPSGDPERLFSPFKSSRPGQLGLGLALARRLARRAGGDLEAKAAAGGGAQLELRLPRAS